MSNEQAQTSDGGRGATKEVDSRSPFMPTHPPAIGASFVEPNVLQVPHPRGRIAWLLQRSAYARLFRELDTFRTELALKAPSTAEGGAVWYSAAQHEVCRAETCLDRRDIEGGWNALHAARRLGVFGMTSEERESSRKRLLSEVDAMKSWRVKPLKEILEDTNPPTPSRLIDAMALRDEESSNTYHKIWLVGDQLALVTIACACGVVAYLLVLLFLGPTVLSRIPSISREWTWRSVSTVTLFGLLGGAFSTLRSLLLAGSTAKIPERVANYYVTAARLVAGVIGGLAGYTFWCAGLVPLFTGIPAYSSAGLAIAFVFGYAGESLVAGVASSFERRTSE